MERMGMGQEPRGLFVIKPIHTHWDLGDPFVMGQEEMGERSCWGDAGPPPGASAAPLQRSPDFSLPK